MSWVTNSAIKRCSSWRGQLAAAWPALEHCGHPLEVGAAFLDAVLPDVLARCRQQSGQAIPYLSALTCNSPFDIALHDAFGNLHGVATYQTYNDRFMSSDLAQWLEPADDLVSFRGRYPQEFLASEPASTLSAWHLVGGLDPLEPGDLNGDEPDDGYPVLLADWIDRDGLKCLKIKLRGTDATWDYDRIVNVAQVARQHRVKWLTVDFNCTVREVDYVNEILDRLLSEQRGTYDMILYVEQPFAYELADDHLDVRSIANRKPLFMDESAHDWQHVRLGYQLGWNGVALKTCKTQTSAILMLCWARAHGMQLMVQDLTNPMLAQIPHVLLAAHADTIEGVETNAMQFYPEASRAEAAVHPGLYRRRQGQVDLSTLAGPGFGYRIEEIDHPLPPPEARFGVWA